MRGIQLLQLLKVVQDVGELTLREGDIGVAQFQARQVGDGADVFGRELGFRQVRLSGRFEIGAT